MKQFNKGDVVWFYTPISPKIYKGVVVQTSNGIEECLNIEYRKNWYSRKIKEYGVPLDFVFDDESDALESIIIFRKRLELSDAELIQKKKDFQVRKQAINEFINFKDSQADLCIVAADVLEDIDEAMRKLQRFDKYDLTNPCMTYEEHRKAVLDKYAAQIADMSVYAGDYIIWMNAVDIPIEVLVYYAAREPYLQRLLNKCDDVEYQRYSGMFKDDVVVVLVDLGFKSMFD